MECINIAGIYKRRKPQETSLWKLLDHHFFEFEERYDDLFQQQYGFYRPVISHVVRKYLECGDLHQGFARIKCPDCHYEYLLAFSCRGRWFCPSCHNKKVVQFGHHLKETVLYPVPHRQYVFSVPKILRRFFFYDRKLLGKLSQCSVKSLTKFLRITLGKKTGIPGVVVAIQTFGDYARWHPHLHALVADGLFLESGYFFVMPKVDLRPLREMFRAHVLKLMKKEGLIDDSFIKMLMSWQHVSGFNVHNQVRIKPDDEKGIENLSQYIIRNTFSLEKLKYSDRDSSIIYRSKMTHGKNKRNFQMLSPLEFIASITQHIPEPSFQLVRYYGWYSNRMRGDRKKQEGRDEGEISKDFRVIDIRKYKPKRIPQLMWRECIKKVWEVDPLTCPKCTGEMRIISFIYKKTVIKQILTHLDVYEEEKNQRAPPASSPEHTEPEIVPYDDGWLEYDEQVFDF
jgi:ssDNA-binding Zn-finger/Zn-ribbon topoisomerase 1